MSKPTFYDRCVKDKHGNVALLAKPNVPIVVWLVARTVGLGVKHGTYSHVMQAIAFGALFTWAWLELFQGVNYFRRLLGLIILVLSTLTLAKTLS